MRKCIRHLRDLKKLFRGFGIIFVMQCFVRCLISFSNYEKYIYNYLSRFFRPVITKFKEEYSLDTDYRNKYSDKVWTLWWQGEECAPDIVKVCLKSQRQQFMTAGAEVIVLNKYNWNQYIDLPQYIIDKVETGEITLTHFSDIIRAELLKCYGGLWIDATVFCTKPIKKEVFGSGLYTVKCKEYSKYITLDRWTGFLYGDVSDSKLFSFMSEAFRYYWLKNNTLIAYLLIDYIIAIAYENFEDIRVSIDRIPVSNKNIWSMFKKLNETYDRQEWENIISDTAFLKLSYKNEFNGGPLAEKNKSGNLTYWGMLSANIQTGME